MSFCPCCGGTLLSGVLFCRACGFDPRAMKTLNTSNSSMKEKGAVLEDSMAEYFRRLGFDVESRVKMKDHFDVSHEIDVLASKNEDFGIIRIAVECKHVDSSMDIKEVRNFHDKLTTLGITKGIFVSTGGFTTDAESHARALGIELWDSKTLRTKLAVSYESHKEPSKKEVIHDALSFNPSIINTMRPLHLRNCSLFKESIRLIYRPYYFSDYQFYSQQTVRGDSVVFEAKGTVVLDGVTGEVADNLGNMQLKLPSRTENKDYSGPYAECSDLPTKTITNADLPGNIPLLVLSSKMDSTRVKQLAKMKLGRTMHGNCEYWTQRGRRVRIISPTMKDIDVSDVKSVKIPLLIGTYQYRNTIYTRTMVAPTGKFDLDKTASCGLCTNQPTLLCVNCGRIVCDSHIQSCTICSKPFCSMCVISKGFFSKKHYCPEHQSKHKLSKDGKNDT